MSFSRAGSGGGRWELSWSTPDRVKELLKRDSGDESDGCDDASSKSNAKGASAAASSHAKPAPLKAAAACPIHITRWPEQISPLLATPKARKATRASSPRRDVWESLHSTPRSRSPAPPAGGPLQPPLQITRWPEKMCNGAPEGGGVSARARRASSPRKRKDGLLVWESLHAAHPASPKPSRDGTPAKMWAPTRWPEMIAVPPPRDDQGENNARPQEQTGWSYCSRECKDLY